MSMHAEIDDLRHRHHALDGEIEVENTQVSPDELKISALKKEKLKIKDLIKQLEAPD
ncbi:MAG: YdcH family protein [Rhodospirillaceae bacterium]|jgi:hypothetical protein|nr:YdcH family protein [Rhodospirillaceae bacterium]MBT3493531.1 YdcH family protein [Rhodospirillaceae bacterium]MBT3779046.1 YdcH family protein [Rhodospirillaceae bacterium]MBT3976870.1 YdcH family protein [Rhodospirillaceae bacterium]MBT4168253.1 YdcH family protein [Rhodospirillaceae bacterium]